MILIAGATGSNGTELIKLLSRHVPVRAMVRSADRAKAISELAFVDVPSEAVPSALLGAGLPVWQADGLIEDYAHYRRGGASAITSGVEDATGKPVQSARQRADPGERRLLSVCALSPCWPI